MNIADTEKYKTLQELCEHLIRTGRAQNVTAAKKLARQIVPHESKYQAAVIRHLGTIPGGYVWKEQAGPFQKSGLPDVGLILNGVYYGFEVKRPFFGEPTEIQKKVHSDIRKAGGHVFVVSYVSEVKKILAEVTP